MKLRTITIMMFLLDFEASHAVQTPNNFEAHLSPDPTPAAGYSSQGLPVDNRISLEWDINIFGEWIGRKGMFVGDVDADGETEIVTSSDQRQWYVLGYDGTNYSHEWTSGPYNLGIERLAVGQVDADPALEVFIAYQEFLFVYDGQTHELVFQIPTGVDLVQGLVVGDMDEDPSMEVALCNANNTIAFDLSSEEQQFSQTTVGCRGLALGETDGSPGLELVATNLWENHVLDAASGSIEWSHDLAYGWYLSVADFDSDNIDEIGIASRGGEIVVLNGDTREVLWSLQAGTIETIYAADIEGDGPIEFLLGDNQWNAELHVLDGRTGNEKWHIDGPRRDVSAIGVGDVNGDEVIELVFSAGHSDSAEDIFSVVNIADQEIVWQSQDFDGPFLGLAHGDVDADNQPELIYTISSSNSGYDDGLYFVHDAVSKELEFQSPEPTTKNSAFLWSILTANVDDDSALEIILPTDSHYSGTLICYDGASHTVDWQTELAEGIFQDLRYGDVDNDGYPEIIAAMNDVPGVYIHIYDGSTGDLEWESPDYQSHFENHELWQSLMIRMIDIENDNIPEFLITRDGDNLIAVEFGTGNLKLTVTDVEISALEVTDLDHDGSLDIVVGTEAGEILQVNPGTGETTHLHGPYEAEIYGLAIEHLTGDQNPDFVFASGEKIHLVDGGSGEIRWMSDPLGFSVGRYNSLLVGDVDEDGDYEIMVNKGTGVTLFGIDEMLLKAGFEQ